MGEVWSAFQPTIHKKVAIKILSQEMSANKTVVARFVQEARALSALRHRHLVDIFAFGELANHRPYYIMEFLEGKSLADYIDHKGPLPFTEIAKILEQTCRALQVVHDAGIIHRDLKPDNLYLVSEAGGDTFIKVLDFGIAKVLNSSEKSITRTGTIIGTPGYMAPEQFEASKDLDVRADIYSLGVILFEMLTSERPFHFPGDGLGAIVARQMTEAPPKPSSRQKGKDIPEAIDALVVKMLAKLPAERLSRCTDVYKAFSEAIKGLPSERSAPIEGVAFAKATTQPMDPAKTELTPAPIKPPSLPGDYYAGLSPKKNSSKVVAAVVGVLALFGVGAAFLFWPPAKTAELATLTPEALTKLAVTPASSPVSSSAPVPTPASIPKENPKSTVQLSISSVPDGAKVFVEGEAKGNTPLVVEVPLGEKEVTVRLESPGYEPWEDRFVPNSSYRTKAELKKSKTIKKTNSTEAPPDKKETANPFGN